MKSLCLFMLLLFSTPIYSQIDSDKEYISAAYSGDIHKIRQLIQAGKKINDATNILTTAIGRGNPDVYWILTEYIDLKKVNNLDAVLYQACGNAYKGYTKIVMSLLENGEDPLAPFHGEIQNFNPIYNLAFRASNKSAACAFVKKAVRSFLSLGFSTSSTGLTPSK